jgi:hypothetical protein
MKRYVHSRGSMHACSNGEWVLFDDAQAALARVEGEHERLKAERDDLLMHKASRDSQLACLLRELCPDITPYPSMNEARDRIKAYATLVSSLTRLLEGGYTQHTADCELSWVPAQRHKSPDFGRYLMKRVNGRIAHGWDHQCGAAGFGLGPDDRCLGCDNESDEREAVCTCDLDTLLATLTRLTRSPEASACAICGKPATCRGAYEGEQEPQLACDSCWGLGNEDGRCEPLREMQHAPNANCQATGWHLCGLARSPEEK